jgi:hypothetical protein
MKTETKTGWMRRFRLPQGLMALGCVGAALLLPGCFVDSSPPPPVCGPGTITVGWFVTANNTSISCAQAGATEVDIIVDGTMTAPFNCNDHVATTPGLSAGNHSVAIDLLDSGGNPLSQAPAVTVQVCNANTDLGNIELSLTN